MDTATLHAVYAAVQRLEMLARRDDISDEVYAHLTVIRTAVARELALRVRQDESHAD